MLLRLPFIVLILATGLMAEPTQRDIEYARIDQHRLLLDLYRPSAPHPAPLLIWVHGGAWRSGSKSPVPIQKLLEHGFAIASVEYRLSPVAPFPAQAHDLKAAIRFLRANQLALQINATRIGILGASAGGHLAALIGVTNGHPELEGDLGNHRDASSDVQAIVDLYGPTNFMTILKQSTPHGLSVRMPAFDLLLLGQPDAVPDLAKLASPVFHVDAKDPPLLMLHGDQDPQVPINQSHELDGAYRRVGAASRLEVLHGSAHGGKAFYDADRLEMMAQFLKRHLITSPPVKSE